MACGAQSTSPLRRKDARDCLQRLRHRILSSSYDDTVRQVLSETVDNIIKISAKLFPRSYLLREDTKKDVKRIARTISGIVTEILLHINVNIDQAEEALDTVRKLREASKTSPRPPPSAWRDAMRDISHPTGSEAYLLEDIAALFDITVYHPFWQVHNDEPTHNMWQLDHVFTPLSLDLQEMMQAARQSDAMSRAVLKIFRETTTSTERALTLCEKELAPHLNLNEPISPLDLTFSSSPPDAASREGEEDPKGAVAMVIPHKKRPTPVRGPSPAEISTDFQQTCASAMNSNNGKLAPLGLISGEPMVASPTSIDGWSDDGANGDLEISGNEGTAKNKERITLLEFLKRDREEAKRSLER